MALAYAIGSLTLALLVATGESAAEAELDDAVPRSAHEVLDCGLRTRFDLEFAQVIDVETRRRGVPVRRYRLQIATKRFGDYTRFLAVFLAPQDERGMKLLTIERQDRRDDHFLYMPFLGKVKRIYGGRRQEAFLGTDFTFEDMERRHAEDFDAEIVGSEGRAGQRYTIVSAVPRYESGYARSEYLVADSDCQIVEVRHFKRSASEPFKVLSTPREDMTQVEGILMPTVATARDLEFHRETEVRFSEIQVRPELESRYFEPSILERLDGLPGLSRSDGGS